MEENLRRSLMISDGELSFLWERPITLTFTAIAVIVLVTPVLLTVINKFTTRNIKPTGLEQN